MYKLLKTEGRAKRGELHTCHGVIQTPVFMNVGTAGAIKGAVSTMDLKEIKCQVQLSNTYHLHLRPGDELIRGMGGLHKFMVWDRPILTGSGGFQVFSLAGLRKIKEEGVYFSSHIDGHKIFMGPEESMEIQSNIASTIAMAFDECAPYPSTREYMQKSVDRTTRWLVRCIDKIKQLNQCPDTLNQNQMLFGINQGGVFEDIRIEHAKAISTLNLDGYAVGGLAVGESHEEMYHILEQTVPYLPQDKPTYLMGVGTPQNILESVERGIDFFDCVLPARNGRHANLYTNKGQEAPATDTSVVEGTTTQPQTPADSTLGGTTLIGTILYVVAIAVAFYFLLFRQPRKEQKKRAELRDSIKIGDNVLTSGGFYGKVVDIGTDVFILEFGTNKGIRVPVSKAAIDAIKDPVTTPPPKEAVTEDGGNKKTLLRKGAYFMPQKMRLPAAEKIKIVEVNLSGQFRSKFDTNTVWHWVEYVARMGMARGAIGLVGSSYRKYEPETKRAAVSEYLRGGVSQK
ncbi:queuine trna-ribosyltransferase [Holotrichia oblita]|nr:queuine trna-ribosyltransferase [Holotrichia oblita]